MNLYRVGNLAQSIAGHDQGKIFLIIKEETDYVYLVDGVTRTIENPKKKNKKHIQPIYYNGPEFLEACSNEKVKLVIKGYQEDEKCQKQMSLK